MPHDMSVSSNRTGGAMLLKLLPAIYQEAARSEQPGVYGLRALLAAFESVLLASDTGEQGVLALGERISALPDLFMPVGLPAAGAQAEAEAATEGTTPRAFLSWLAQWVALEPDFSDLLLEPAQDGDAESEAAAERAFRNAIARIVPLYAARGTRYFLEQALRLFIPEIIEVDIDDRDLPGLQVGKSAVGKDSWLVTYRPFHFSIRIRFAEAGGDAEGLKRRQRKLQHKAETIIELSKPAHTTYDVRWEYADARRDELAV